MESAKWVRERRTALSMSLKDLAVKVNANYVFLSRMERGMDKPGEDLIRRLANALNFNGNMDEFIAGFGRVPESIEKLILDDPSAVVELPAFFKSRRKKTKEERS